MEKIKKYAVWVFSGIAAILAIILGITFERRKIGVLKTMVEKSRLDRNVVVAQTKKEFAVYQEKSLEKEDIEAGKRVASIEDKLSEVEKFTKEATSEQISDEFNSRYRPME